MAARVPPLVFVALAGLLAWALWPRRAEAKFVSSSTVPRLPAPGAAPSIPAPAPAMTTVASRAQGEVWITPAAGLQYQPLFDAATKQFNLPTGMLSRMAKRESSYNPNAKSSAGALGIMQILPKWHPDLDPGELALDEAAALDPRRAIPYAAKYLRELYNRFGNWTLAVAAYNAGPTAVAKYDGVPPFPETRLYVAQILPDIGFPQPDPRVRYA